MLPTEDVSVSSDSGCEDGSSVVFTDLFVEFSIADCEVNSLSCSLLLVDVGSSSCAFVSLLAVVSDWFVSVAFVSEFSVESDCDSVSDSGELSVLLVSDVDSFSDGDCWVVFVVDVASDVLLDVVFDGDCSPSMEMSVLLAADGSGWPAVPAVTGAATTAPSIQTARVIAMSVDCVSVIVRR